MTPTPPLRVVFFRPTLGDGGADRVTLTILERLDRRRFAPILVLVRRRGALVDAVPADVPVIDLDAPRLAVAAPALARALRRLDPDVVVCTAGGANVVAVAAHGLARSRARLVLSERSAVTRDRGHLRSRLERQLKALAYRRADAVTAVSDGVARELVAHLGVRPERVLTVYNPIVDARCDELAAAPIAHPWFHEASPIVLAVGRLVAVKDYPTMLGAFTEVRRRCPTTRLVILGDGADRATLERHAAALGLADAVAFLGFEANPFPFMKRARLLLQSSHAEGLPGTIIQSMACGTPVVSTDCDHGPREVIRDGVDGFLVPVGDGPALAERAVRLLRDDALHASFSRAAREAAARFSVAASMRRYEAAIMGVTA